MYLNVKPNLHVDATKLAAYITKQIVDDTKSNGNEFPTWTAVDVTLTDGSKIIGFKNSGQLESIGWTKITPPTELIQVEFVRNSQTPAASDDQKAMLLCRFANMLRSHFSEYIDTISLLDL